MDCLTKCYKGGGMGALYQGFGVSVQVLPLPPPLSFGPSFVCPLCNRCIVRWTPTIAYLELPGAQWRIDQDVRWRMSCLLP